MDRFSALNTEVVGISFDSLEEHTRFAAEHGIVFPLVADEKGAIRGKGYGSGRITFIVDMQGVVRHAEKGIPDNARLLDVLRGLPE